MYCRLPGLESSSNNKVVEDNFYNTMMLSLLKIVTRPLFSTPAATSDMKLVVDEAMPCIDSDQSSAIKLMSTSEISESLQLASTVVEHPITVLDGWIQVKPPSTSNTDLHPLFSSDAPTFRNLFSWRLFTKKHKSAIVVDYSVTNS